MRKLYVITAEFRSVTAELTMKNFLANYSSHFSLAPNTWLVSAGGSAHALHAELQQATGDDAVIFVAAVGAATAWSKTSGSLANWMPRQLAAATL